MLEWVQFEVQGSVFAGKPLSEVLSGLVVSEVESDRFVAVNMMLATDQIDLFFKSFVSTKTMMLSKTASLRLGIGLVESLAKI